MKNLRLLALLIALNLSAFAQTNLTQNISGTVLDADNKQPIVGALLTISATGQKTITDADGKFVFAKIAIGRIDLVATSFGYEPVVLKQLLLGTSKELILNIEMLQSSETLQTVEVTATENKGEVLNDMAVLSARQFTVEETKRYPGSFNDPARMVSAYAGVSTSAEGGNEIIVRGNSPKGILWRLEGVDIPNPNHFGDEGSSGGPISIINVDMLANSEFYTAAFPPQYGNALSGVFDISFRKGNTNQHEFSAGFGMLGLEATAEGPMGKTGNNSFLVNYRYSSLDLIDKLGIADFGGVPKYQDAAFNVNFRTKSGGQLSFFGMGGLSGIEEKGYEDEAEQVLLYSGTYSTNTGVIGATYLQPINANSYLKSTISASGYSVTDQTAVQNNDSLVVPAYEDAIQSTYLKAQSTLHFKSNANNRFQTGFIVTRNAFELNSKWLDFDNDQWQTVLNSADHAYYFQAFGGWKHDFNPKLSLTSGVHATYFGLNGKYSIDPRAGLNYKLPKNQKVGLAVGMHSKLESMSIYLAEVPGMVANPNQNLALTKALHVVASYDKHFTENLHFRAETYFQYLFDVPIGTGENSNFSLLNSMEGYVDFAMVSEGSGRNYGIDLTFERYFDNDFYFLTSGSLFKSEYKTNTLPWRDGRFAGNYTFNAVAGKDFTLSNKNGKKKMLTLSLKATMLGGKRYTGVLLAESIAAGEGVYDTENPFGIKGADVFMMNLAATYRVEKKNLAHEFKLDVQNATNNQTALGEFYNDSNQSIEYWYQWTIFPVVSYKLYF